MPDQTQPAAEFGAELRRWRKQHGMTQATLAAKVYVSDTLIRKIEAGGRVPTQNLVIACDEVLDTGGALARLRAELHVPTGRRRVHPREPRDIDRVTEPPNSTDADPTDEQDGTLRAMLNEHAMAGPLNPIHMINTIDEVRYVVDDLLDDGAPGRSRLERLEAEVGEHAHDALSVAPQEMICRLGLSLLDAGHIRRTKGPDVDDQRLRAVVARLAVMVADELTVLGHVPGARSWYTTAITAAQASTDRALHADVQALAAMLPLYHGRPTDAARAARRARELVGDRRCLASALAPLLEGVALGHAGRAEPALHALAAARGAYDRLGSDHQQESIFGLSPRRQMFLEGRLLTSVAEYQQAWSAHRQALQTYPDDVPGDPTLIFIDRAAGLIGVGQPADGAELVTATMLSLPPDHRGALFIRAARAVLGMVPVRAERLPAVRACREVLDDITASVRGTQAAV